MENIDLDDPPSRKKRPIVHGEIEFSWKLKKGQDATSLAVGAAFPSDVDPGPGSYEGMMEFLERHADEDLRDSLRNELEVGAAPMDSELMVHEVRKMEIISQDVLPLREIPATMAFLDEAPDVESEGKRMRVLCAGNARVLDSDELLQQAVDLGAIEEELVALKQGCLDAGYLVYD